MENQDTASYLLREHRKDKPITLKIDKNGLEDEAQGRVEFRDITEVRLDRIIGTKYNEGHSLCRIKTTGSDFYIRADFGDELESGRFRHCMLDLHAKLSAANSSVIYGSGVSSKGTLYAINFGFILVFAIMEITVVYGVQRKGNYLVGILVLIAIPAIAFFLLRWANGLMRPITYYPNAIPENLLPDADKGKIGGLDQIKGA